ncbi:MAG: nucleoside deaminase [Candidatus Hermodarchaeota archaeon]
MIDEKDYEKFMLIAFEEAKLSLKEGNKGFGAIIIKNDKILAKAHDTEITETDPTAHAEINVIKKASKSFGRELQSCILFSTHEPCPMCMTAIIWSKISELVYSVSIEDSLKQGRNVINLGCKEIKLRVNANISIKEGILKQKCLLLYNKKIREYIRQFRTAASQDWKNYETEIIKKRKKWFLENRSKINKFKGSDIEKAYKMLIMKLEIDELEAPIIEKSNSKLVFHSKNFCSSLEACKILDLDTRIICRQIFERPTEEFIKLLNPKLRFSRNYNFIRPYADYCEEIISLDK